VFQNVLVLYNIKTEEEAEKNMQRTQYPQQAGQPGLALGLTDSSFISRHFFNSQSSVRVASLRVEI